MHRLYDDLEEICETLADELSKTNEKLSKAGGEITAGDLEYINRLTHAIKSVKTSMAMIDAEEGGYSYDDGMSMNGSYNSSYRNSYASNGRGRSGRRESRDSRGRYSRGGSRDSGMVSELRELMKDAPDEQTRMEMQRLISRMETM